MPRRNCVRSSVSVAVVLAFLPTLGIAGGVRPPMRTAAPGEQAESADPNATVATDQSDFEFRSGFWMNLHHLLYLQAVLAPPNGGKRGAEISARNAAGLPAMSAQQQTVWEQAVSYYARFAQSSLVADPDFISANCELQTPGIGLPSPKKTYPRTLITISSVDPGNQGYAILETLFHEASHALVTR